MTSIAPTILPSMNWSIFILIQLFASLLSASDGNLETTSLMYSIAVSSPALNSRHCRLLKITEGLNDLQEFFIFGDRGCELVSEHFFCRHGVVLDELLESDQHLYALRVPAQRQSSHKIYSNIKDFPMNSLRLQHY